ncbi:MAG: SH3 domain-containing protein [Pseudomonadota bacterium]|nr:SH3 domain-containing protein [Pseudomonadota bacterium]MDQ8002860.1 SH3 domain-containing protein [Pseudomonadota bacterium]MDQ8017417.1 SH3 domain-containing protein [Pseudomonadota bacterium]
MRPSSRTVLASLVLVAAGFVHVGAIAQQPQPVDADLRAGSVLRAGPSTRDAITQRVPRTVPAWVYGCTEQRGWCEVELEGGARGWVAESRLQAVQEEDSLDHRTSTPLPQRGVINNGAITGVYVVQPWGYGYYGGATVIELAPRGGPGEPMFPMRPGWARGQPMPR